MTGQSFRLCHADPFAVMLSEAKGGKRKKARVPG